MTTWIFTGLERLAQGVKQSLVWLKYRHQQYTLSFRFHASFDIWEARLRLNRAQCLSRERLNPFPFSQMCSPWNEYLTTVERRISQLSPPKIERPARGKVQQTLGLSLMI
ncbi:MAG: hypothetical protein ACPGQS_09110 [Bradymonadia bacterium]